MQFSQIRLRKRLQVFQYLFSSLISPFSVVSTTTHSSAQIVLSKSLTISIWFDFMETEEEEKKSW